MHKQYTLKEYIDKVDSYLKSVGKRLLTEPEKKILLLHLQEVVDTNAQHTNLKSLLLIEAAAKTCDIHPDLEEPSKERIKLAKAVYSKEVKLLLNER